MANKNKAGKSANKGKARTKLAKKPLESIRPLITPGGGKGGVPSH